MDKMLNKKKIILIIGGGIAAYKSLDLIRLLKKQECEIKVVLTESGKKFVTPLSVASLSQNKVYQDIFDSENETETDHISLSRWCDIILFAPTTANSIAKLASGRADDLASTLILASNKQIILAPAMNVRMWLHKSTQSNIDKLLDFGYLSIGPSTGEMACGEYGEGKMSSPDQIYEFVKNYFSDRNIVKNKNLKALVTAGPTKEYIDPVRFITNNSSGKQGYEIASSLAKFGVKTTLISGPSALKKPENVNIIKVESADQMYAETKKALPVDIAVCTAAITDFKPEKYEEKVEWEKEINKDEKNNKQNKKTNWYDKGETCQVVWVITDFRKIFTKTWKQMMFLKCEWYDYDFEVVLFAKDVEKYETFKTFYIFCVIFEEISPYKLNFQYEIS